MGRELRLIEPDEIYHVTCRGNNRGLIAWDTRDYRSLVGELDRAARRHRWNVLSWCLMPNHHHVLVRAPHGGFSEGFQVMNGSHSRRTNRRYGRTDHLFRNRPEAKLVDSDAYLVTAIVYIARNPLEAGLCENAREWEFGSYRALLGAAPAPPWLAVDEVLATFGRTRGAARAELARLVHQGHLLVSDTERDAWPVRT